MQKLSRAEMDRQIIEECMEDSVGEIWERNVARMRREQEERRDRKIKEFMRSLDKQAA